MPHGIGLLRYEEGFGFNQAGNWSFRLRFEAVDEIGMPREIFLHVREPFDILAGVENDDYVKVASPEDLVTYPVGDPDMSLDPPYFRKSYVDAFVASRDIALQIWTYSYETTCELIAALNRKDRLVLVESVRCGDPLEESQSTSMSVSA